jgi:hypothetical protein
MIHWPRSHMRGGPFPVGLDPRNNLMRLPQEQGDKLRVRTDSINALLQM